MKKRNFVFFLGLLLSFSGFSQKKLFLDTSNFNLRKNNSKINERYIKEYKSYKTFNGFNSIDKNDKSISLNIENIDVNFQYLYSYINENGYLVWGGKSLNSDYLLLLEKDGKLSGLVNTVDNVLEIKTVGNNNVILGLMRHQSSAETCDTPAELFNQSDKKGPINIQQISGRATNNSNPRIYKLIIAYTPEFASTFGSQNFLNSFLELSVELLNQTYITNNTGIRARLTFSYKTSDSESGDKETDYIRFAFPGFGVVINGTPIVTASEFDEVFVYGNLYNTEVSLLYVKKSYGGRANRQTKTAVQSKNAVLYNYTHAHEIGHMFGLEHDEDQFTWFERNFGGLNDKKAYGYVGNSSRTVMAYPSGTKPRRPQYSDLYYDFPEGDPAGDNYARGHYYLKTHLSKVLRKNDRAIENLNNIVINSTQTYHTYATDKIETSNYIVEPSAVVKLRANNKVKLKNGTTFRGGSNVSIKPQQIASYQRSFSSDIPQNDVVNLDEKTNIKKENILDKYYNISGSNGKVFLALNFPEKVHLKINITDIENGTSYVNEDKNISKEYLVFDLSRRSARGFVVVNLLFNGQIKVSKKIKI